MFEHFKELNESSLFSTYSKFIKQCFRQIFLHRTSSVELLICFIPQSPYQLPAYASTQFSVIPCSTSSKAVTLLDFKSACNELETPKFQVCRVKADKQNRHWPPCYSCPATLGEKTPCQAAKASLSFPTYRAISQPPVAPLLTSAKDYKWHPLHMLQI